MHSLISKLWSEMVLSNFIIHEQFKAFMHVAYWLLNKHSFHVIIYFQHCQECKAFYTYAFKICKFDFKILTSSVRAYQ